MQEYRGTDEDIKRLQAEAVKRLQAHLAQAEALADPLRLPRRLFGAQLAKVRYGKRLSQSELAGNLGMRQPQLSLIENGKGNPTLDTLLKITEALDVNLMVEYK